MIRDAIKPDVNMFLHYETIEAYGTGMSKILKAYEGIEEQPTIETAKNVFMIILPNINAKYEHTGVLTLKEEYVGYTEVTDEKVLSENEEKILEYEKTRIYY